MRKREKSDKKIQAARNREILVRLGGYLMQYKGLLLLAMILTVGSNLFALIGPMLSGYAVDAFRAGH